MNSSRRIKVRARETPNLTDQEKTIFSLLDANLNDTADILSSLERKAQYNFVVTSSMAAVVVLVNIELHKLQKVTDEMQYALVVFGVLYFAVAACSILSLQPRVVGIRPLDPTWETVSNFRNYSWSEFRNQLILHYVDIHEENESIIRAKNRWIILSYLFVAGAMLAILAEAALFLDIPSLVNRL
ncbi:MAG: hypothetical protein OXI34_13315 [Chloroflexota bacterium]|nr:hypothetical protein [Chloroflexota bacterium]MDE2946735.1 hypothetical protein [Chloroflexota bacterium]